jgi:hypothetical protein
MIALHVAEYTRLFLSFINASKRLKSFHALDQGPDKLE